MSRIDDETVVDLLKSSVAEPPYPPDRYERIVATARKQHRRSAQTLGSLCVGLAVLGSVVAIDRQGSSLGDPTTVLVAAVGKAEDIGTSQMAGTMTMDLGGFKTTGTFAGVVDFRTGRGSMTLDVGAAVGASTSQTIVYDGAFIYTSLPDGLDAARAAGKRWIRADFSQALSGSPMSTDPRGLLESLKSVSSDVRAVGRDRVRGVRTTHYTYTLDKLPGGDSGPFATADVKSGAWVDADGLVRRIRMDIDMSKAMESMGAQIGATSMSMTMDFFDYGSPVEITIPRADEVLDGNDPLVAQGTPSACMQAKQQQYMADYAAKLKSGESVDLHDMQVLIEKATAECQGGA